MFSRFKLTLLALSFMTAAVCHAQEPKVPDVIETAAAQDDDFYTVWSRIRDGFKIPNMDNPVVKENLQKYLKRPDYIHRMANRSSQYLYHIIEEVDARGMPTEIALLPFVESAFVSNAKSRAKAAGLWQFMPATGRHYDLDQSLWKDERYDVLESTGAALTYLQRLYDEFGDWQLALAAYNWGEGNIRRQIKKNQAAGKPTDYMSLKMPAETRNYYPKLQAIKEIVMNPDKYGIRLPVIYNEPSFIQIFKEQDIDVKKAAHLAGMKEQEFTELNPSFNRPVIVASHHHSMLVPSDKIDTFVENLVAFRTSGKPLSSWTTYRVGPNESLATIAQKAHMTEAELREANQIPAGRRVKPGSLLLVSRAIGIGDAEDISSDTIGATFSLAQDYRRVSYRVRKGDTLARVAKRLGVSPTAIVKSNKLKSRRLRVGQTLVVNVPIRNRQMAEHQPSKPVESASSTSNTSRFYVVRRGDTLYSIASRFGVPVSAVKAANNLTSNNLSVGTRLAINQEGTPTKRNVVLEKLPPSVKKTVAQRPLSHQTYHTVRKGDTLFSIASSANISVNRLKALNNLRSNNLTIGQKLRLK